jgi:hypothetical protein
VVIAGVDYLLIAAGVREILGSRWGGLGVEALRETDWVLALKLELVRG